MVRKNCNCFSDCALWFLCKTRLNQEYRSLELKGQAFSQVLSNSGYVPNPMSTSYVHEEVILALNEKGVFQESSGHSLREPNELSEQKYKKLTPEELREKRLSALGM